MGKSGIRSKDDFPVFLIIISQFSGPSVFAQSKMITSRCNHMAEVETENLELYTIGHSTLEMDDFQSLLKENYIQVLVDVRSQPYSRFNPQFNRESFKHAMAHADIEYVFAGEYLGGRPTDPTCYKDGVVPDGKADYLKLVDYAEVMKRDWYRRGIERLLQLMGENLTAIMCSEEDPVQCHRHHLIAQTLLERGITVWHIRANRDVEEAKLLPEKIEARQPPLF
jgi:uncharacterized protein (DUF488 family)